MSIKNIIVIKRTIVKKVISRIRCHNVLSTPIINSGSHHSVVMCTKLFILILTLEQNKSFPQKNMILIHIHVLINGGRDEVTGTVP